MRLRRLPAVLAAAVVTAVLAACSSGDGGGADDRFKVVTTFTIIANIARNAAGEAAAVESITRAGAQLLDYPPAPRHHVRAQPPDLVLWHGINHEPWLAQS